MTCCIFECNDGSAELVDSGWRFFLMQTFSRSATKHFSVLPLDAKHVFVIVVQCSGVCKWCTLYITYIIYLIYFSGEQFGGKCFWYLGASLINFSSFHRSICIANATVCLAILGLGCCIWAVGPLMDMTDMMFYVKCQIDKARGVSYNGGRNECVH